MLKNYLLVALRNLLRNKIFSLINIFGLAVGLAACFLIYQYVQFEESYDTFHTKRERLYRVPMQFYNGTDPVGALATNAPALGPALKAEFPEVADYARLVKTSLFTSSLTSYFANSLEFSRTTTDGSLVAFNEEHVYFADPPFLTMFSFPLKAGSSADALAEPNTVVITEQMARKYFGDEPALGKVLRLNREMVLKVSGVLKDIPENSHLQFDILISFPTLMKSFGDGHTLWVWSVFYNYILLTPGANPQALEAKLPAFQKKYLGDTFDRGDQHMKFFLQPIADIHLHSQFDSEQSANGSQRMVYFLSILAVFILVVAWINYINLSTAKALERAKEVGLRKVVGAQRIQLMLQFFMDALLVNFLALIIAATLVVFCWSWFETLVGKSMSDVLYRNGIISPRQMLIIAAMFFSGVVLVGAYPALVLSSFQPVQVLKGKFLKSTAGTLLRKGMIAFQYALSVLLIAGAITIYQQLSFMQSQDPGYAKDQLLVLEAPAVYDSTADDRIAFFKNSIAQLAGVRNMTASADVPGQPITEGSGVQRVNAAEQEHFGSSIMSIDTAFFSTYDIKLLAGRLFTDRERMTFRLKDKDEAIRIVVNKEFIRRMGIQNPKDALHEKIIFDWGPDGRRAEIIGVTADFHQMSLKEDYSAIFYILPEWSAWKYFSINLQSPDLESSIDAIHKQYTKAFPDHPFSYFFLDDFFDRQYHADRQFENIFGVFTALAIVVTCLGLLGLSVFSVAQRTKEMGIRKVLGASATRILLLFTKDFVMILVLSWCISAPVIYFAGNAWLETFSFRISLNWMMFVLPVALLIGLTLLTIGVISLKAAVENPVKALRHE
ncbi:ABC transporter permease [Chryseolinea soli]|uniref:FtsX-like permease family protein n=1 Tax=Chryseolinea soli TaxID=2321403 RepID=A0A385SU62_9BACT|nr:ABC transporter permease [Chryseolinea soli]AYB34086.1 FtsX-like permease family protein [Chryseolinea soli]